MCYSRKAIILLIGGVLFTTTAAFAAYPDCIQLPSQAIAGELTEWRKAAIVDLDESSTGVAKAIRTCFGQQPPSCLNRVFQYAERNNVVSIDRDSPYETTPERQPPVEFLVPGATGFVYTMRTDVEELARSKGWPVVRYKSRHSGGFDSATSSLLMVYVPGDKRDPPVNYDQWLNFALPADTGPDALEPSPRAKVPSAEDLANEGTDGINYPRTFTMISLTRAKGAAPAEVYFQMFRRQDFKSATYAPSAARSMDSCLSCHPNGLRPISPLGYHVRPGEKQLSQDAWAAVKTMNEAMDDLAGGKLVSWRSALTETGERLPFLKPASYWPVVGAIKPLNTISRTQAFIIGGTLPDGTTTPGCYKRLPTISLTDIFGRPPGEANIYTLSAAPIKNWTKVRNAMLCETCHNNRIRYALNSRTDEATINYKILVDQSMPIGMHTDPFERGDMSLPPSDRLTQDERISLVNCLQAETELETELLGTWMSQEACQ
jgi:hypothetical protein